MAKKVYNPLLGVGIQDFFDPKNDIKEAVNTDAVIMKDTSGNKKWSIKHNTNIVKYDHYSPEPDNKMVNSGFETDLSSWTSVLSYILNDQFTTDRAAGAVNGTQAEPTGGTRTVVDTNSKLSIAGGQASFATGGVGYGDPGLWYGLQTRMPGKILLGKFNFTTYTSDMTFVGWDATIGSTINSGHAFYTVGNSLYAYDNSSAKDIGIFAAGTDYYTAIDLRSTGAYYFIRGGIYTNWTLVYISSIISSDLYPAIGAKNLDVFTADNIRIPTATWLPTPLSYSTFATDGATATETVGPDSQTTPSLALTGGTVSGGKLSITPSLGSELVTNGDMSSSTGWTLGAGWTIGSGVMSATSVGQYTNANQVVGGTTGQWYMGTADVSGVSSGIFEIYVGGLYSGSNAGNGAMVKTVRNTTGSSALNGFKSTVAGQSGTFDNFSIKALTLSSLFSTVSTSDSDVIADANVTLTAGTQAGLVLNLDSTATPANFVIAYHDGTNVKLEKNVGGTYTTVQSTAVTYVAGATLRVIKDGTKYRVYYNNALVGSEQTISDAGIISNTKHGLFSTYSGNSFDNFTLFPRKTHFEDAPFEELTATRDTGTKYAGTASAKLVAGGTDATFLQSLNVGDTATYTLIAYAYTTGGAVTTADLNLYYDGAVLSTSFTDMTGGWYRLTGTLTGVASSKDYGVKVKAGKTVYLDTVSLQAGSGATIEVTFENSSSGLSNYTFENNVSATEFRGLIDGNN